MKKLEGRLTLSKLLAQNALFGFVRHCYFPLSIAFPSNSTKFITLGSFHHPRSHPERTATDMAPLLYFNDKPYRAGISTKHHEAHHFTHTGTWEPELTKKEQLEERRRKLKKQMSDKRREDIKANPSRHRTASMSMVSNLISTLSS